MYPVAAWIPEGGMETGKAGQSPDILLPGKGISSADQSDGDSQASVTGRPEVQDLENIGEKFSQSKFLTATSECEGEYRYKGSI